MPLSQNSKRQVYSSKLSTLQTSIYQIFYIPFLSGGVAGTAFFFILTSICFYQVDLGK